MKDTVRHYSQGSFRFLIGVPYAESNCWEITRIFYDKVLGIKLSHYCHSAPDDKSEVEKLIYTNKGDFEKVESPKFGDIALIKILGVESHIAVYVGEGQLLHTSKRLGSHIDRVAKWDKVITGYYRVKEDKRDD